MYADKKCATKFCRNQPIKGRGIFCCTCLSRRSREANPLKWSFWNLRANAKARGKAFELTFEEFKQFCFETNYIASKGRTLTNYSIDRRDNAIGYTITNIRAVTVSENSRKGSKVLIYDWQFKTARVLHKKHDPDLEDWFDSYVEPQINQF